MADGAEGGGSSAAEEPDCRFVLANERTFLAWQRTALGLLALSVAVVQLPSRPLAGGSAQAFGLALNALAILAAGMGVRRWAQSERAIRRGEPLPKQPPPWYLGAGVVLVCVIALVATAASAAQ
ncbi:MAG: YidH family protein [Segniliparus sp.]|uniref:YidH family protein n=1 Tax=Segniliparus sp. TaxID=2804064 RepID=UPI003F2D4381